MASLATIQKAPTSLTSQFAERYGIERDKVEALLQNTVLKSKDPVSTAEVHAFMIIANQYKLNPFTKEIFGFLSGGKMLYVISVDGWTTLINRQQELDGVEFEEHFDDGTDNIWGITCKIHRKDRGIPTTVTEYLSECKRDTSPWKQWPIRMLRHKALIQCARVAFGLAGAMDEDEAERMPGFVGSNGPILEGTAEEPDPWVAAHFKALKYTKAKAAQAMRNYAGERNNLLGFLQEEAKKAGITVALLPEEKEASYDRVDRASNRESEGDTNGTTVEASMSATEQAGAEAPTRTTTKSRDNW